MSWAGRRWTWTAGLVGVSAAVVIPILGLAAARTLGDSTAGTLDVPTGAGRASLGDARRALLVAVDGTDVVGLTVLAVAPTGAGGTAVVVPTGSRTSVDGFDQPTRLAAAYRAGWARRPGDRHRGHARRDVLDRRAGGPGGIAVVARAARADRGGLPGGGGAHRGRRLGSPLDLPPGPQELTAEQAAAVLFTRTPNETEVVRLPAQQAVWKGIVGAAARVASPASGAAPPTWPGSWAPSVPGHT